MTRLHMWPILVCVSVPTAVALAGCGGGSQSAVQGSSTTRVVVPGGDRFAPFALVVTRGTAVTFHNADSDKHSVVSVPGASGNFNSTIAAGASWTVTLHDAGLYRYYCSIHARYDSATQQVEGLPNADHPGQPMEGVIVVE